MEEAVSFPQTTETEDRAAIYFCYLERTPVHGLASVLDKICGHEPPPCVSAPFKLHLTCYIMLTYNINTRDQCFTDPSRKMAKY